MSVLLADYWFNATRIFRTSSTSYASLYDDGRSANIVVMMGGLKVQLPKWLLRDYISLSFVAYPNQMFVRRNPYHVRISDEMREMLAGAELHYDPGGIRGTVETNVDGVPIDPQIVLDPESRTNLARMGDHNTMFRMIVDDIADADADTAKRSGVKAVSKRYGWTQFEIVMATYVRDMTAKMRDKI